MDTLDISVKDNESQLKINMFVILVGTAGSRRNFVSVSNFHVHEAHGASFAYTSVLTTPADTVTYSNFVYENYDSISNAIWSTGGAIQFNNMTFKDSFNNAFATLQVDFSVSITMTDISFQNYTGSNIPIGHILAFSNNPLDSATFNNVTLRDCEFLSQSFISLSTINPINSIEFDTLSLSNVRYSEGSSIIQISNVHKLVISNMILNDVASSSSVDIDSVLVLVTQIDLDSSDDIIISGLDYQNSSIGLVSMATFVNTPPATKNIRFSDFVVSNCQFVSQNTILDVKGIEYDLDIVISMDNISFNDISYTTTGHMLELNHQLSSNLTISNSRFDNIQQGIIYIASSNRDNADLLTNVFFDNVTVNQVQQNEASFVTLEQGGRLHILNSSFTNMYIYQDGAVLTGGASDTVTIIHDSIFMRNSAQNGGVFNVKDESTIKVYTSNITDNFAISSGVIYASANGNFEIYDSFIYHNYANINPVSLLLDTAKNSIISGSQIYNNHALSRSALAGEFSSCSEIRFVNQNFIDYSNSHFASIISDQGNEYQFQLAFASLIITSSTDIFQETAVLNSFASTLEIADTVIRDFSTDEVNIRAVSSTISLNNLTFSNFTVSDQADFILDVLDSALSIQDSISVVFRARSSQLNIQGITYELIENARELGVISECFNSAISDVTSTLPEVSGETLIRIEKSHNMILDQINLENTQKYGMKILSSNISSITQITMENCTEGLYVESSSVSEFKDSALTENGFKEKINGGAIHMVDSEATIENVTFTSNTAHDGGAISFQ